MGYFSFLNAKMDIITPKALLVDNKDGLEILQYYLLTGEMYPGIEWREE
ncbi:MULTISPECIES: hypothetical protein [Sphingobacterium]|nr:MULTISPECIES: hypothetical protein [Sphingobacterium]